MRDAVSAPSAKFLGAVLLVCYLQIQATLSLSDETPLKSSNDDPQIDYEKRDWNKDLHIWGKRAWSSLQDGWGKRSPDKRAWQNLHSGWGKRLAPEDEDILRQLVAAVDRGEQYDEYDADENDDVKRNWKQFNGGWGKRSGSKWDSFKGVWGKREPAWSNLKGIWGKRSFQDQIAQ